MLILLLGDCHGRLDLVHNACLSARETYGVEAAIQVGDFGFYPKILHAFLHEGPRRFPIPLHVIDGNHEDHRWLNLCKHSGASDAWAAANLFFHDRATAQVIGGLRIGFVGGALNADRRQEWAGRWLATADGRPPLNRRRTPKSPVWANWVRDADVDRAVELFSRETPDLLVTHSCPAGIGVGMEGAVPLIDDVERFITRAGHFSGPFHDCGEGGLSHLWTRLSQRPPLWVFGHFHRIHKRTVSGTQFVCVGSSDGSDGFNGVRSVLLDTERRSVAIL